MGAVRRRVVAQDDPHNDIIAWYHKRLRRPARPPWKGLPWEPVCIGPTWEKDGKSWRLPELSLGWDVLGFCGTWLQHEQGKPWRFTDEQARFVLWWYSVDKDGRFFFRDGVLQRLKGWGKDPVGACLLAVEAFGPCRFDGLDGKRVGGIAPPIDVANAWVQTAAVSLEQTKNTMRLFPILFSREAIRHFGIQVGKEVIHGLGDSRLIQAVTSSPATLEGARATKVLRNETHLWDASNEGHEMADVIERNATKSPDGAARTLGITNAYEPGGDSIAQRDRETWEKMAAGGSLTTGLLYDSLEAPAEAPLDPERVPDVVAAIRGDSLWLDIPRIVQSVLDTRNPPSRSRRFWYNQITATEDALFSPQEWDPKANAEFSPQPGDIVTLGLDPSLADDHTALVGCHVDADHAFLIASFEPQKATGEIDRKAVDRAVRGAFEMYDVVGFYSDVRPLESYVDAWGEEFGEELCVKSTPRQAVAWDMRGQARQRMFTDALARFVSAVLEPDSGFTHDGSRKLRWYVLNARRAPNPWGFSVRKEHRESDKKIDAVPAMVLARLARLDYLALPPSRRRRKRSGVVW